MSKSPSSGPIRSGHPRPLRRGKACSVCRMLKIKCDGAHPICGPCQKNPRSDACDWDNGQAKSKVAMLTETVETLRARITELENPGLTTPSVTLHDPYHEFKKQRSRSPLLPEPQRQTGPSTSFSPAPSSSSLPPSMHRHHFATLEARTTSTGSSTSPSRQLISRSPASSSEVCPDFATRTEGDFYSFTAVQEPPQPLIPFLIDRFLLHAAEFGFFLDILSFHRSTLLVKLAFGHHHRPTPALLTTAYLWGVHLLRPDTLSQVDEHALLIRALHHVVTDTLGTHPKRILHTIQAEVLLATYFFRNGRLMEAKTRLSSAVSLVLSTQMHRIRSSHYPPFTPTAIFNDTPVLPQAPEHAIEEGELINGFWTVFSLHKMLSFTLDPPTSICGALEAPGLQIDTPWPFESHDYRNGCLTPEIQGNDTIKHFLSGIPPSNRNDTSLTALVVKASILCHQATYLSGHWAPNLAGREAEAFNASFRSVDTLIDGFRTWLPQLIQSTNTASTRTIMLIHGLTNAATIKLHGIFSFSNLISNQKCVQAACDMVNVNGIDLRRLGAVNSVYGILWQMACQVFISEISRRQSQISLLSSITEDSLRHHISLGLDALKIFSDDCVFIRYQRLKVEEAYAALNAATTDYLSATSSLTPLTPSRSL